MVFKNKFFLDLGSDGEQPKAVTIAPPTSKPAARAAAAAKAEPAAAASSTPAETSTPATNLTTAEAIAAELAAEQATRPAPSLATFAPECVSAGGALPSRRRRAGADLGGFKEMARGMMRS